MLSPWKPRAVLYEKSGMYCYQPLWCCIVPALLISPFPMWNVSWHREQLAALDRTLPWPQVFFGREQGGVSAQPGKTSGALAMLGMCGSADSDLVLDAFSHHTILLTRMGGNGERLFFFFSCFSSKEWVLFAIRLHRLLVSSIPHQKPPFLARLSPPEWLVFEHFWPAVKKDLF